MNISISYNAVSDVGRVRSNNEDMALVLGNCIRDNSYRGRLKLDKGRFSAIVADGMGGYGGGEIASEIAIKSFDQFITNLPADLDTLQIFKKVGDWFEAAQNLIISRQSEPDLENMGCTFTGIFSYDGQFFMLNAGDSRVYRLRGEILKQLTVDHSERERLKNPNVPSNLIYNALGVPEGFIDKTLLDEEFPLQNGDMFIICSDGLSDMISDVTIEAIANQYGVDAAQPLVDAALQAGGRDNCTVVVFDYHTEPKADEVPSEAPQSAADEFQSTTVPLRGMAVIDHDTLQQLAEIEQSQQQPAAEPLSLNNAKPQSHIEFNIDDIPTPNRSEDYEDEQTQPPVIDPQLVVGAESQTPAAVGYDSDEDRTPTDPEALQTPTAGGSEAQEDEPAHRKPIISSLAENVAKFFGQSKKKS